MILMVLVAVSFLNGGNSNAKLEAKLDSLENAVKELEIAKARYDVNAGNWTRVEQLMKT
jgi:hypothetical protein